MTATDSLPGAGRPGWAQPSRAHDRRPSRRPPVVLVAHGSPDPRSPATVRAIAAAAGATAAFLDFDAPDPVTALSALAESGHRRAVLVPLLLTNAYHGRVDVPRIAAAAARALPHLTVATTAPVGGPHLLPALLRAVATGAERRRVVGGRTTEGAAASPPADGPGLPAGGSPTAAPTFDPAGFDGLVLASAGTRDAAVREQLAELAARLGRRAGVPATAAFASAARPTVTQAIGDLRATGRHRVAVVSYFIAPGVLHDRVAAAAVDAGAAVTPPLGACPELVAAITDATIRYDGVVRHSRSRDVERRPTAPSPR